MPNTHSTLTALFSDIADSIRSKAGTSAPIVADAFPAAIDAIPSGGGDSAADGIIDRTISGAYTNANVSVVGSYAFYSCGSLTKANFPVCTTIGAYAFNRCYSLTEASFPVCTTIDASAFYSCSSLTKASFPVCKSITYYAFQGCTRLLSLYLLGSSVPNMKYANAFASTPISNYTTSTGGVYGSIIVQESMLSDFQKATNWSLYSSRFSVWNGID